jgi:hypothetical protein
VGVADRERKKAERDAQHNNVHHRVLLLVARGYDRNNYRAISVGNLGQTANRLATLCLVRGFSVSAATTRICFRDARASNVIGIS